MRFNYEVHYMVNYLPTKTCEIPKLARQSKEIELEIEDLADFPIAFVLHEKKEIVKEARSLQEMENMEGHLVDWEEEIRYHKGQFYEAIHCANNGIKMSDLYEDNVANVMAKERSSVENLPETAVIISDNLNDMIREKQFYCSNMKCYNGKFWRCINEPYYSVIDGALEIIDYDTPFGLDENDYSALEFTKAKEKATQISGYIEVRMPSVVFPHHPVPSFSNEYFMEELEYAKQHLSVSADSQEKKLLRTII